MSDLNPSGPGQQVVADQFGMSQSFTPFANQMLKVTWWGAVNSPTSALNETLNFNIQFYDGAFVPNPLPLGGSSVPVTATGVEVPHVSQTHSVFRYEALIHINSALNTGTGYWLSVVDVDTGTGPGGQNGRWLWAPTSFTAGGFAHRDSLFDNWSIVTTYPSPGFPAFSRAFQIEVVEVPEPAWLGGLFIVLAILWSARSRIASFCLGRQHARLSPAPVP